MIESRASLTHTLRVLLGIFATALLVAFCAGIFSSRSLASTDHKLKHFTPPSSSAATESALQSGTTGTGVMSVNFVGNGTPMGNTEVAGVVSENNWVQATGNASASPVSLSDNTGALTGASISWTADNTWILPITDQSGNVRMMEGYLDNVAGDPTTVNVSGLPVTTQGYMIYVYADGDNRSANRSATYQITGTGVTTTSIGFTDAGNANFSSTFTQASNSAGNYVVFSVGANVTAFTITATPAAAADGTERAPVNGIQIVPVGTSSGGSGGSGSGGSGSGGSASNSGEVISLNFVGSDTSMAASESAGVVAAVDWNNGSGNVSNSSLALNNQNGVASGATATWTADNVWALPVADQPGNQRMMNGYLDDYLGGPTTVNIAGLPSSSSGYTVYVYADGDNRSANRTGNYQISGTGITTATVSLTDAGNANFSGNFTKANNSNGNYVVFNIPSGASGFTVTATPGAAGDGTERAPVNGIQMVPNGSTGSGGSGSGGSGGGGTTAPPTVSITSPASGATISGTVTVTASASSSIGVATVQFKLDGGNVGSPDTSSPYAYALNTSSLSNGSHTLAATATDTAGTSTTSSAISVTVSNQSGSGGSGSGSTGPLKVLASNPRYFTNGNGKAILLAGSHTWSDLVDNGTTQPPPAFNYNKYITFMVNHNFNFTRMWSWMLTNRNSEDAAENYTGAPYIWARPGPGTADDGQPQWDLTKLNQGYFNQLRARVIQAGNQGIYTSIMLFDGWEWQFATQSNDGNPFNSGNNVNGINCGGTCPTDNSQITSATWAAEQAYIQKVIDTVNDLNNVMYEVSNEAGPYSTSWQASVISFVKQYEATKPNQHPIGMTYQYEGGSDSTLYSSNADWVSPGTQLPPPATGNKVIINDTDHSFYYTELQSAGQNGQREWAWENFAYGNNLAFMDPYLVVWPGRNAPSGGNLDPYWNEIRNTLTDIRNYGSKIDLANMIPQGSLSTTGYCLAEPGVQYLVFNPFSGETITVQTVAGTYTYEWFNPTTHSLVSTGTVTVGSSGNFNASFSGDAVLWLHK